ncbi:hypothetical protein HTZ77_24185 [Nonomuraea sp. SMC257]|uniref:Resolvase/invertase-type recombinase catalytic domain-containing protein n=1 Tax=Nonomuraea montanisoli TaxID=2741721 RepID=A0A7Y6IA81_9ACTN|nr:hypothetical protein [Nonomuraea montanisoli]NUW34514.1 hypothetical protein [Nonomuraea montanisoli]
MLFLVAATAAEVERDLISERILEGLDAARAACQIGGRPVMVTEHGCRAAGPRTPGDGHRAAYRAGQWPLDHAQLAR